MDMNLNMQSSIFYYIISSISPSLWLIMVKQTKINVKLYGSLIIKVDDFQE